MRDYVGCLGRIALPSSGMPSVVDMAMEGGSRMQRVDDAIWCCVYTYYMLHTTYYTEDGETTRVVHAIGNRPAVTM